MRDVSHKPTTLRVALAEATLSADPATLARLKTGDTPKGDPLPVAKVAAILAAKKTTEWIPYCHNVPIEHVDVAFEVGEREVSVRVKVVSVSRTGVEMEAMTAAAAAVLTLYDMLKMIDDGLAVTGVRLLEKHGGKSDHVPTSGWEALVVVASDRVSRGEAEDVSGEVLTDGLEDLGAWPVKKVCVPDDVDSIRQAITLATARLVLVTGGTGLTDRDVSPEALNPLFELRLPGIEHAFRSYGEARNRLAMVSRCCAGTIDQKVVVAVPGSPQACRDALSALFPGLLHAMETLGTREIA